MKTLISLGQVSQLTKGTTDCATSADVTPVFVTTCRNSLHQPIAGASCFYNGVGLDFGRSTRGSEPRKATMISLTIRCNATSADSSQHEFALAA
jgi:hypothetical protein